MPKSTQKMTMKSQLRHIGPVPFPAFTGERVYMVPFYQFEGLPNGLSRWQPTINAMLRGIESRQKIFLMIDQSEVQAGKAQRRPGVHIDGYWRESAGTHGGGGHIPGPVHKPNASSWGHATFEEDEALVLASDVSASRALVGEFQGPVGEGGDCSNLDLRGLVPVRLAAGQAYIGNVTMLHESLPVPATCNRTLVRLNLPGISHAH